MTKIRSGLAALGAAALIAGAGCGDDRKTQMPSASIDLPKSGPVGAGGPPAGGKAPPAANQNRPGGNNAAD